VVTGKEIRLALDAEGLDRLSRDPVVVALTDGAPETQRLLRVYFDTPDHALARGGIGLHLRRLGDRWVQTVTTPSNDVWERDVAACAPDLGVLPEQAAPEVLGRPEVGASLRAELEMDVTRTRQRLVLPAGAEVELALERGEARAGGQSVPVAEASLELRNGQPSVLFALARRLHEAHGFRLRHLPLLPAEAAPGAARAEPLVLDPGLTVEGAFRRIAASCVEHLRGSEACALDGADPSGVHQMRVAARRLRSGIRLFGATLPPAWAEALSPELAWIANELSDAREWDVFLAETLRPLCDSLPKDRSLRLLEARAVRARSESYARVREAVSGARYTRLLLDVAESLSGEPWRRPGSAGPVAAFATATLEEQFRAARRLGRKLRRLDARRLHKLRIRTKRLRYAVEFFGSLYRAKPVRRFGKEVRGIQDHLGHLQDVAVTQPRLAALVESDTARRHELEQALGTVAGWQAAMLRETRAQLLAEWEAFERTKPFWR
jgi:inorganic triphosphatase YgiF